MPSIDKAIDNGELKQRQPEQELVCVTGAGGFIGSWVVKELLLRGYRVRGTARDPAHLMARAFALVCEADRKNAHLLALEGAEERLALCCADDLVPVAVEGTRNVIRAAADAGVQRVVFTSSYGAVHMDPNRCPDAVLDETCWSDYEYCKKTGNLYCCAKMMAEITATEEAAKRGLELAVVVPSMTMGPMLQQSLNFSSSHVARYLTGAKPTYPNAVAAYTDVRDVARAHVLVYEHPDACGRYLCIGAVLHRAHFLQLLGDLFPQYHITAKYKHNMIDLISIVFDSILGIACLLTAEFIGAAGAKRTASPWRSRTSSRTKGSETWDWSSLR
ncbi:Bifunctional dihydroflavonol 4-reductase/flavanone 4-reductase [Triticum urartu]|uniref:Bifunctional dihydroflavonol 4-reductase/flavanone 4-reductase n=1 Tax=Triticum urartu TaxID=4572 RepID=M7ZH77_TRIUA|nr:Bifunctional dihydroflavonol 4-reductase/flavanone 4-reductase [Triticum urartu]